MDKRNYVIDIKTVDFENLANALTKIYADVKKQDRGMYTPSALVGIRAAIHRKLISPPNMRNINILDGPEFAAANRVFLAKCMMYTALGNPKPKHKPCINNIDMAKLKTYFDNYNESPTLFTRVHLVYTLLLLRETR